MRPPPAPSLSSLSSGTPKHSLPSVPAGCGCYGAEKHRFVSEEFQNFAKAPLLSSSGWVDEGIKEQSFHPPSPAPPSPYVPRLPTSLGLFPLPLSALLLRHPLRMFLVKRYSFLLPLPSSACPAVQTFFPFP